jgi:hypothetical protein
MTIKRVITPLPTLFILVCTVGILIPVGKDNTAGDPPFVMKLATSVSTPTEVTGNVASTWDNPKVEGESKAFLYPFISEDWEYAK